MRKGTTLIAGLVVAPLLLGSVAGCNKDQSAKDAAAKAAGSTGDAKSRVMDGFQKTYDTQKLRVTMKLDVDRETVDLMDQDSTSKMSDKVESLITDSSVVVDSQSTDKPLKDERDQTKVNQTMVWKTDSDLVNLTVVGGKTIYAKADLAKLASATGGFDYNRIHSQLGATAPAWVKDFVDGKWLGLDVDTVRSLVSATGQTMPDSSSVTPAQQQQLMDAVKKDADTNVTYSGDGDQLKAAIKVKPFVKTFYADAQRIVPSLVTPKSTEQITKSLDGLKDDAVLNADITMSDDKVKKVSVDLMQLTDMQKSPSAQERKDADRMKAKGKTFPIVVEYSDSDRDVKAPEGARMVTKEDLQQLMGGMSHSMAG